MDHWLRRVVLDIGSFGIHHLIALGLNVSILILDTTPYSALNTVDPHHCKKDIGLCAMNHDNVYVASVTLYSSYSQVLQALIKTDKFNGPSVILAYLPHFLEDTSVLKVLKETKLAVDAGPSTDGTLPRNGRVTILLPSTLTQSRTTSNSSWIVKTAFLSLSRPPYKHRHTPSPHSLQFRWWWKGRGKLCGLSTTVSTMDSITFDDLVNK